MKITRAVAGSYVFDFSFEGSNDFLAIATPPSASGALLFAWKPEVAARAMRIVRDPNFDLETQMEADLSEFPVLDTIFEIQRNTWVFKKSDLQKIVGILENIAAPSSDELKPPALDE